MKDHVREFHGSAAQAQPSGGDSPLMADRMERAARPQEKDVAYDIPVKTYRGFASRVTVETPQEPEEGSREWYNRLMKSARMHEREDLAKTSSSGDHTAPPTHTSSTIQKAQPATNLEAGLRISPESLERLKIAQQQKEATRNTQMSSEEANNSARRVDSHTAAPATARVPARPTKLASEMSRPSYEGEGEGEGELRISEASLERLRQAAERTKSSENVERVLTSDEHKAPAPTSSSSSQLTDQDRANRQLALEKLQISNWFDTFGQWPLTSEGVQQVLEHSQRLQSGAVYDLSQLRDSARIDMSVKDLEGILQNWFKKGRRARDQSPETQIISVWQDLRKLARMVQGNPAAKPHHFDTLPATVSTAQASDKGSALGEEEVFKKPISRLAREDTQVRRQEPVYSGSRISTWNEAIRSSSAERAAASPEQVADFENMLKGLASDAQITSPVPSVRSADSATFDHGASPASQEELPSPPLGVEGSTIDAPRSKTNWKHEKRERKKADRRRAFVRSGLGALAVAGAVIGSQQVARSAHEKKMVMRRNRELERELAGELALKRAFGEW